MDHLSAAHTEPPLSRSEQKYQAIVLAAESVFIEMGYQKANMDRIAEIAQVSKRTVYNHFANKEELFHLVLNDCCEELMVSTDHPYNSAQALEKQLFEMLSAEWELYASGRFIQLTRVILGEYVSTPKFLNNFITEVKERESGTIKWLRAAIDDGRLEAIDPQFAYDFLRGAVKTFAHEPLLFDQPEPNNEDKAHALTEIIGMFLQRYEIRPV